MVIHSAQEIMQALRQAGDPNIVITTHYKPDADAMGSSLGFSRFLRSAGFRTTVVTPSDYAAFLKWMRGNDEVINFEKDPVSAENAVAAADFIFCLDFNQLDRINEFGACVSNTGAKKIVIDHHQYPGSFQDMLFWDDLASSTCELIYRFIRVVGMEEHIDRDTAACLYTGIVTDTGSFRFASCSSETMRIAANLMDKGIRHEEIFSQVFDSFTENRVRFIGYALSNKLEVLHEYNTALITINRDELKRFDVITGDTEGLVNYGLSIEGIKFAVLIIDRTKVVKMSFRSKGNFAANMFAMQHFGGGGHFHAAGGSSKVSLEETVTEFKKVLKLYKGQLNA